MAILVEDQFGEALVATIGDGAAGSGPGELAHADLDALRLGFRFGQTHPGHFRIGVGHAGNHLGVEEALLPGGGFGGDMGFMHRLVRQHRLADQIADGEDMRHVGAHLLVHRDETPIGDHNAGFLRADFLAIGRAARRLQDHVVQLRFGRGVVALESHQQAFRLGFDRDRLGLEHDLVEALGVHLLPDLEQISIGTLHDRIEHFHDFDTRAQRRIDRGHLQADDATADDQQPFRDEAQFQRAGGIDDARVVRDEGQMHRLTAGGDDALFEADDFLLAALVLAIAGGEFDFQMMGIEKTPVAAHGFHLARLGHARQSAGQLAHHLAFVSAQLVQIHGGCAEGHAQVGEVRDLVHDRRHMQQGFGGNAADVKAHAAQCCIALHQHGLHAQIGGPERGRVTSRPGAEHQHFAIEIGFSGKRTRNRRGRGWRRGCGFGGFGRWGGGGRVGARFQHQNDIAFGDLVADLDLEFLDRPGLGRGYFHRGLVAFQYDQRIFRGKDIAWLDQHLDDIHAFEVADVGDFDFHETHEQRPPVRVVRGGNPPAVARGRR